MHARVLHQRGAGGRAAARDNVDRALRQQVARNVRPLEHAQRRVLARLDHARAAGGNARGNFPGCMHNEEEKRKKLRNTRKSTSEKVDVDAAAAGCVFAANHAAMRSG